MLLHIELPNNLAAQSLLAQKHIPCLCRIGGGPLFELLFQDPLPIALGHMEDWSNEMIDARAPAGAGGKYTHYCFGTVTLERIETHLYRVIDLSFFERLHPGWFPIVKDGEWCEPVPRHTPQELAEIEALEQCFRKK